MKLDSVHPVRDDAEGPAAAPALRAEGSNGPAHVAGKEPT